MTAAEMPACLLIPRLRSATCIPVVSADYLPGWNGVGT